MLFLHREAPFQPDNHIPAIIFQTDNGYNGRRVDIRDIAGDTIINRPVLARKRGVSIGETRRNSRAPRCASPRSLAGLEAGQSRRAALWRHARRSGDR